MTAPLADDVARAEGPLACAFCDAERVVYELVCPACVDALGAGPALVRLRAVASAARAYVAEDGGAPHRDYDEKRRASARDALLAALAALGSS